MILIAGLGNPGKEYEATRHNIGFMVVSSLCEKYNLRPIFESKFNAIVAKGNILGLDTILVKPLTFMNLSGSSILKLLNWYKINIEDILVVYDDIDFNLGEIRFKKDGSAGGHGCGGALGLLLFGCDHLGIGGQQQCRLGRLGFTSSG